MTFSQLALISYSQTVTPSEELLNPNWFSAMTVTMYRTFSCSTPHSAAVSVHVMYSLPVSVYGNRHTLAGPASATSSKAERFSGKQVVGGCSKEITTLCIYSQRISRYTACWEQMTNIVHSLLMTDLSKDLQ